MNVDDEFDDIAIADDEPNSCPSNAEAGEVLPVLPGAQRHEPADSWIYFIQRGADGPIKIGITKKVSDRMRSLQTGSPERLQLLFAAPGDASHEAALHLKFRGASIAGEWFHPTKELRAFILGCRRIRYWTNPDNHDEDDCFDGKCPRHSSLPEAHQ